MTVAAALKQGFGLASRTRSGVWVLLLVNLGLAALAALPVYQGILGFTGHSRMSDALATGFSMDWLTDFAFNRVGAFKRYGEVIVLFGMLALPVNAVLSGGVLARFRSPEQGYSLSDFFRNTVRYAWRLIRLMILGLICYWIAFRLLDQGLNQLTGWWTRDWLDDRPVFWVHGVASLLLLVAVGFVNVVMDYARVKLVMDDGAGAIESFLASVGFSIGRFGRAVAAWAVPSLCGVALLALYLVAGPWIHSLAGGGAHGPALAKLLLAVVFVGQQAIMWGRYWLRVATWASEWSNYAGSRP
ncbi:MAG TPA: hypothetical protein VKU44_10020 [Terriglobia bacterium]|nr:hypothetical protein [Terriglobia bacterium]